MHRSRTARGFTLYELLITIVLVAILATLGAPLFEQSYAKARQTTEINALFHGFHLARKESILRHKIVSLCPSSDGVHCVPGRDWSNGWILYREDLVAKTGARQAVILSHQGNENFSVSSNRRSYTLRGTIRRATNGTFIVCDRLGRVPPKALIVSYTGRPRVASTRPDGRPYTCAG